MLIAAGVVIVPASSAYACRCVPSTPREYSRASDAVFTGRLVESKVVSSGEQRVFTFQVGRVYKGAVASLEEVASLSSGVVIAGEAACALELRGDGLFLVFADTTGGPPGQPRYFSDSCTGTRRVSDTHPVPGRLGPATPPDALSSPSTASPEAEPTAAAVAATPEVGDTSLTAPELLSLAVLGLVGAVLAVLWRRRDRNRTTTHGV